MRLLWPLHLAWTLARLTWLERPALHLACRVLDHAFTGPTCRRCGRPLCMVRDYREHVTP